MAKLKKQNQSKMEKKHNQKTEPGQIMRKLRVSLNRQVDVEKLSFWRIFTLQTVLFFAIYGIMLVPRFSTDSYSSYFNTSDGVKIFLNSGRTGAYFLNKMLLAIGVNTVTLSPVFTAMFTLAVSWSATVVLYLLKPHFDKPNRLTVLLLELAVLLAYANIYFTELYFFSDVALIYTFDVIFMTLALILFFHRNRLAGTILALVCLCLSLSFYQASLGFFMIFGAMIILVHQNVLWPEQKTQNLKPCLYEFLRLIVVGAGGSAASIMGLNILASAGFSSSRGPSLKAEDIFNSIHQTIRQFSYYYPEGYPSYLSGLLKIIFVLSGPILLYMLINSFSKNNRKRYPFPTAILTLLTLAACLVMVFAPLFVSKSVWLPPRSICSFFAVFTLMAVVMGFNYTHNGRTMSITGPIVVLLLLIANIVVIQGIALDQIEVNRQNREEAEEIVRCIQTYELESGQNVDTISWRPDSSYTWTYPKIKYTFMDMNVRAGARSWSLTDCISYYAGRRFLAENMPDEIWVANFLNQEWSSFEPKEQIRFEGNKMYLMVY